MELKTANAMPLLRYSCSSRIISLPTAQLNARRCVTPCPASLLAGELRQNMAS